MILKKLNIHNIRSYKDGEINFPSGSTLLMGDIGSGKTSILLAIEFALFGLQPSQKGSSLLRNNEDEASVKLEFEIDGKTIIIERNLKKTKKSISQSEAAVSIDNERFEGSVTEVKNRVLSLLSYPPEFAKKTNDLYKFTVYTPQEEMKQIILEPAEVRLNTLRHVFGIDKYKRISENLTTLGVRMRQDIRVQEAQLGDIDEIKKDLDSKRQGLSNQQQKVREITNEITKIQAKKLAKQAEIKQLETQLNEKAKLENEREKAELMLSNKADQLRTYEQEIGVLRSQVAEGKKFRFSQQEFDATQTHITTQGRFLKENSEEHLTVSSRIQANQTKINEAEAMKAKISGLRKCPTCLQKVDEKYKQNIISNAEKEIQILTKQNQENTVQQQQLQQKIKQNEQQIESYKNSLSEMQILKVKLEGLEEKEQKIQEIEKQKFVVGKDISMMQNQIKRLVTSIAGFEKYTQVFEQKSRELQEISQQENALAISKAEVNKEIQFLNQQIKNILIEIQKLQELGKKINQLKELESWLSNKFAQLILYTEKNVMLKLRGEFSQLFGEWFSILVSDDLSVRLDETFSPIVQQQDYEIDYAFLSGGERTAVALAYRLALNQVINSLLSKIKTHDIVILDEPTDGFSESQLDKMRDVLGELKVKQLILVSHEPKIESFVDNIIRFKKTEGVTSIEA